MVTGVSKMTIDIRPWRILDDHKQWSSNAQVPLPFTALAAPQTRTMMQAMSAWLTVEIGMWQKVKAQNIIKMVATHMHTSTKSKYKRDMIQEPRI